jgi:hypothetical protein
MLRARYMTSVPHKTSYFGGVNKVRNIHVNTKCVRLRSARPVTAFGPGQQNQTAPTGEGGTPL